MSSTATALSLSCGVGWTVENLNTPFQPSIQGPDGFTFSLAGIDLTIWNKIFADSIAFGTAGNLDVDFFSFADLICGLSGFSKILAIIVLPVGGAVTMKPGLANPLNWFMGAGSVLTLPDGSMIMFSLPTTSPGQTVDATHRNINFADLGGAVTLDIAAIGK